MTDYWLPTGWANTVAGTACNVTGLRWVRRSERDDTHTRYADLMRLSRLQLRAGRFEVRILTEARNFSRLPWTSRLFLRHTEPPAQRELQVFPAEKLRKMGCWPFMSRQRRGKEQVELYFRSSYTFSWCRRGHHLFSLFVWDSFRCGRKRN
jgi:hypothetical protein